MSPRPPAGLRGMRQRTGTAAYEGGDGIEAAARLLRRALRGRLYRPGDAEYDARPAGAADGRAGPAALVARYDEAAARPFDHSALCSRLAAW